MSQVEAAARCFHCQCQITDEPLIERANGKERLFCGADCQAAARKIFELALDDFYDYRDQFDPGTEAPSAPLKATMAGPEARRLEFDICDRSLGATRRLSVRVPDIRCAACTWLIEKSLAERDDVTAVRTVLADRTVTLDYSSGDPLKLVEFIESLGFTVLPDRSGPMKAALAQERKSMLARLGVAGIGMMQVMMYALATYVAGDGGIEPAYESLMRWASLAVTTPIVFFSAMPFHAGAWRDLRNRTAGMDVPVSLAILAAYILSVFSTLTQGAEVYFDSVSMFSFLLLIGRYIELGSRQQYESSQMSTDTLLPASALLAGSGRRIPLRDLAVGDQVIVMPGESMPADGILLAGSTRVAEAAFTGESRPVEKSAGMRVLAGSDNLEGEIRVEVTACLDDFVLSKIAALYRESAAHKPAFSIAADKVARYFVAFILLMASASAGYWYLAGGPWFEIGLAVLVVSCPCALSLATPVAYTVALSTMKNAGIVISNGIFLEKLATITRVVFDKTGTLTTGKIRLLETRLVADRSEQDVLAVATALERTSRHPVALAFAGESSLEVSEAEVVPGAGVSGCINGVCYRLGSPAFAAGSARVQAPSTEGMWVLLAADAPLAWFRLGDETRPESVDVLATLAKRLDISMFTGDGSGEAVKLGQSLGIADTVTGMMPADKVTAIRERQQSGDVVLMVGDGVNDAAAMAAAHTSVAVSPVDIVVQEAADATLLRSDLALLPVAVDYAIRVKRIIRQNITWAVGYNLCVVPLAVSGLIAPWMAALGMSASSALVVLNANRLRRLR
ncbi:MAG: heavy metal translocating P-type ATPase [Pseudomonadota bacterium]